MLSDNQLIAQLHEYKFNNMMKINTIYISHHYHIIKIYSIYTKYNDGVYVLYTILCIILYTYDIC